MLVAGATEGRTPGTVACGRIHSKVRRVRQQENDDRPRDPIVDESRGHGMTA
ncbi:hypothetical protein AB0K60_04695 [Thermopolyspora sp. NPDC052614]|uniref:hypothetical protein n=1 Tax=Thermopolyspora sp. NPDC052614 TaxID=3155682 RepID=UPI003441F768